MGFRESLACSHELVKSHRLSLFSATHLLGPVESHGGISGLGPGCLAPGLHQVSCFLLLDTASFTWIVISKGEGGGAAVPSGTSLVFHFGKKDLELLFIPS